MPSAPGLPPLKPTAAAGPARTTTERGYGHAHQKQREEMLVLHPLCQRCGEKWSYHLHHKDRNPFNRSPNNVEIICEDCHKVEHARA